MTIARNRLEIARSAIRKGEKPGGKEGDNEEEWWYSDGIFVNFASDVLESSYRSKDNDLKRKCSLLHGHLGRIGNHLDALLNICSQANWQKKMVLQHNLDKFHAMEYGSVIADAFITRYRSSYDSIGWAFKELANQPGSISPKFKELRDAYKEDEDEFVKNLGEDLANLIKSCDWFDQIKDVRDAIIHYDFNTSGFMASRILFQVSKWSKNGGFVNKINFQGAMINENLVDFELYAGVHMGYSLWLLEELARIGYPTLKIERFPDIEPKKYHDGFEPLNGWILRVLAERPLS